MESRNTVGTDFLNYAFAFNCKVDSTGVRVEALFDDRVVERWLVERIVRQFEFLLCQLNANSNIDKKLDEN